jgi:hypothetical protein
MSSLRSRPSQAMRAPNVAVPLEIHETSVQQRAGAACYEPAYGCVKYLSTVTTTNVAAATAAVTNCPGGAAASGNPPNTNAGACVFNGGNVSGVVCDNNTNSHSESSMAVLHLLHCCYRRQ